MTDIAFTRHRLVLERRETPIPTGKLVEQYTVRLDARGCPCYETIMYEFVGDKCVSVRTSVKKDS